MTKLIRYYENDDFLHLVLEYVPGGELYNILDYYFQKNLPVLPPTSDPCDVFDKVEETKHSKVSDASNVDSNPNLTVNDNINSILSLT